MLFTRLTDPLIMQTFCLPLAASSFRRRYVYVYMHPNTWIDLFNLTNGD